MVLPDKLVSKFAKMVKPETAKKETTVYGTIVEQDGAKYLQIDGSGLLTPISATVDVLPGERVTALIKNHSVIVNGNITSPAARTGTVFELEQKISSLQLIDMIYPVGSLYLTVSSANPEAIFAGTKWEQIRDRFLLASGSAYGLGTTGGEASHTLTVNELPSHQHDRVMLNGDESYRVGAVSGDEITTYIAPLTIAANSTVKYELKTSFTGGSQPHNNMPPYLAVNVWKRIE